MSNPGLAADQLLELLLQLKKTTPASMRQILNAQPQIAYALITLMVSMNAVNFEVFQRILADYSAGLNAPSAAQPAAAVPPHIQAAQPFRKATPPTAGPSHPYTNGHNASYPQNYGATAPPPQPNYSGYPAAAPATPAPTNALPESLASLPEEQKAMVMQLLSMTPEQINMLGPTERSSIMQLKATLGIL